ncbi:hypothetical protein DFP78_102634 [Photobacterium lutimaris]|nr:hypothetical protein DFP78_102634 [Photobacterium lutimaris]
MVNFIPNAELFTECKGFHCFKLVINDVWLVHDGFFAKLPIFHGDFCK